MATQRLTVGKVEKKLHVYTATAPRHGGGMLVRWNFDGMTHTQFPPIRVAYLRELLVGLDNDAAPFTATVEQPDGGVYLLAFRKVR